MKFTQEIDYALRTLHYLSYRPTEVIGAAIIAEEKHIPLRFLLKILRKLNQADITDSKRGVNGGYKLKDPNRAITYLEVVEAIQGPIKINRCMNDDVNCVNNTPDSPCPIHDNLIEIQGVIRETLREKTFEPQH